MDLLNQKQVNKIWSLNPSKYKTMSIETAMRKYIEYVHYCKSESFPAWWTVEQITASRMLAKDIKDFDTWVETEI